MAEQNSGNGSGGLFMAFVMGAAIGGGLALLAAPRSGRETRNRIRQMADDARDRIQDVAEEAESRIRESIEDSRETVKGKKEMVEAAIDAGKEAMEAERAKHQKSA